MGMSDSTFRPSFQERLNASLEGEILTIKIRGFPPQSNNMYSQTRTGLRFPTKELKEFKNLFGGHMMTDVGRTIARWNLLRNGRHSIRIERIFAFKENQIISRLGRVKKIDVTNRIKALDDGLSILLGVDDSMFDLGSEEKAISSDGQPFVIARLQWIEPNRTVSF